MKIRIILTLFLVSLSYSGYSQFVGGANEAILNQGVVLDLSPIQKTLEKQRQFYTEEQWKILMQKKYLTVSYNPCYVDDFKTKGFLRYNLADDQMEFLKDNQTYFLKKEQGKKVKFTTLGTTYKVFELNGRLDYFLVQKEGKNSLLVKQIIKYVKPKEPKTSYDEYRPADFIRVRDQFYFAKDNKDLVEIPRKKKRFYEIFEDKSKDVMSFVKKNKISYKSLEDLEKIITYYNSL